MEFVMNNNWLLTTALTGLPLLAIGFVGLLLLYKIYKKIRCRFDATVNCWFCNQNSRVPYREKDGWMCHQCEQYNGFTKDGDYNREIYQQHDCSSLSDNNKLNASKSSSAGNPNDSGSLADRFGRSTPTPMPNGFCGVCNEAQRRKVEELAHFEPKYEARFEEEVKVYKALLEEKYRLCATCDRHLNKVLREKKKMVLGSKFLDFIIKGAERFKQPHFAQLRRAQYVAWKRCLVGVMAAATLLNVVCLCSTLPPLQREQFTAYLGATCGERLFVLWSVVLAFARVCGSYVLAIGEQPLLAKALLFGRTLGAMLLYSLGFRWTAIARLDFGTLFVRACPFINLCTTFAYSALDSFRLTHFTFLLVLWSVLAGGFASEQELLSQRSLMLLASGLTLVLLVALRRFGKLPAVTDDAAVTSFHKIYAEDYLSEDEDTLSLLSQHLDGSGISLRSNHSMNRSFSRATTQKQHNARHARTSPRSMARDSSFSQLSLNRAQYGHDLQQQQYHHPGHQQKQLSGRNHAPSLHSLNSSFRSYCGAGPPPAKSPFSGASVFSTTTRQQPSLFTSNMELNSAAAAAHQRAPSTVFGMSGFQSLASTGAASALHGRNDERFHPYFAAPAGGGVFPNGAAPMTIGCGPFSNSLSTSALHSPLSVSTNTVYQPTVGSFMGSPHASNGHATNLLSPSRFSMNCLTASVYEEPPAGSWFPGSLCGLGGSAGSGAYYHNHPSAAQQLARGQTSLFQEQRGPHMSAIDENMSRASSQSSGFESQNGRMPGAGQANNGTGGGVVGGPHEGSYNSDLPPPQTENGHVFQPIGEAEARPIAPFGGGMMDSWMAPSHRKALHMGGRDSFNLRRINDELPHIKRGDLLRKWKESQAAG